MSDDHTKKFSPSEKVAIVLLSMGEDAAAEVLRTLPASEVRRVLSAMARLGRVDQITVEQIQAEFAETMSNLKEGLAGSPKHAAAFLQNIATARGLDVDPSAFIDFATPALRETLNEITPKALGGYLQKEHPQVITTVLLHLDAKKMGEVLRIFPSERQVELIERMAKVQSINPEFIEDIEETLRRDLGGDAQHIQPLGGAEKLAAMLAALAPDAAEAHLKNLAERDPELADAVEALMFTFTDLLRIAPLDLQQIIKLTPAADLRSALRGAPEDIANHLYSAMSERAAQILKEDVEQGGKIALGVVQTARSQMAALARQLITDGKITLADEPLVTTSKSA